MKKIKTALIISFLFIFLSVLGMYIGLAVYYKNGFSYGTVINGISCTGKTLDQITTELLTSMPKYEGLTILAKDGKSYSISCDDVDFECDYSSAVKEAYLKQNAFLWGLNLLPSYMGMDIKPDVTYDKDKLFSIVEHLDLWKNKVPDYKRKVEIAQNEDGFVLINEKTDILDEITTPNTVFEYFDSEIPILDLQEAGCYENMTLSKSDEDTINLYKKLEKFQDCNVEYHIGDEVVNIGPGVISTFVKTDEAGNYVLDEYGNIMIDEDKFNFFMDAFDEKYSTYNGTRLFRATDGRDVLVEGGTYGKKIDIEKEKAFVLGAIAHKMHVTREPEYALDNTFNGAYDIGKTYIEVDMTNQHLYYYVDGAIVVDSDIVTGKLAGGHGTITGTYYVMDKGRNITLRGRDYESFVKYWIHVHKGIGIHDASWRHGKFGGEIYKYNGSHGCVNTRLDEVAKIWEMVETGTPVVMFY